MVDVGDNRDIAHFLDGLGHRNDRLSGGGIGCLERALPEYAGFDYGGWAGSLVAGKQFPSLINPVVS